MIIGQERREPLEGESVMVALPQPVTLETADDSALVDAIIVGEYRGRMR
jgi:hypothetical protein